MIQHLRTDAEVYAEFVVEGYSQKRWNIDRTTHLGGEDEEGE